MISTKHKTKFEMRCTKSETNSNVLNFENSKLDIVSRFEFRISSLNK